MLGRIPVVLVHSGDVLDELAQVALGRRFRCALAKRRPIGLLFLARYLLDELAKLQFSACLERQQTPGVLDHGLGHVGDVLDEFTQISLGGSFVYRPRRCVSPNPRCGSHLITPSTITPPHRIPANCHWVAPVT
jgi:hypothetical protein